MDLFCDMLIRLLEKQRVQVEFPDLQIDAKELVEMKSYQTLCRIREILMDQSNSDEDCVMRIEAIICEFGNIGSNCGLRHD